MSKFNIVITPNNTEIEPRLFSLLLKEMVLLYCKRIKVKTNVGITDSIIIINVPYNNETDKLTGLCGVHSLSFIPPYDDRRFTTFCKFDILGLHPFNFPKIEKLTWEDKRFVFVLHPYKQALNLMSGVDLDNPEDVFNGNIELLVG